MDKNLQSKIRENLVARRANQFQWLADLVKTPSESQFAGEPGDMTAIAELTAEALHTLEFGVERHAVSPNGSAEITNLVVRHEFAAGPVVALVAHGDTRPCGNRTHWRVDPFGAEIRNGVFYGLGALAKADLTVYACALAALRDARPDLSGTVELHFTFDGEADGLWGSKWLLDNTIVNPDYALGSGNAYAIGTSSTGDLQLRVEIESMGSEVSADPMEAASTVMDALYALRRTYSGIRSEIPGIGSPSLVIGQIEGGYRPDTAPVRVVFTLDRRLLPDEDPAAVEQQLTALIAEEASQTQGAICRINRIKLSRPMKPGPGTDNLAGVLERRSSAVMGAPVPVYGVPYGAATRHYAAVGIPSVLYGAGPDTASGVSPGGANECLVLDDLRKATEVVALTLAEFMTPAG
ncbi:MAG: M20/M25/M40 family metallo-hydrolase [Proteobacteria bacterium]|nr:M20/M25/M40 family metallo-hydrolase [Pseudomonadota bacterium]